MSRVFDDKPRCHKCNAPISTGEGVGWHEIFYCDDCWETIEDRTDLAVGVQLELPSIEDLP